MSGLIKKLTQTAKVLEALRYAKANNDGWVCGEYFLRTLLQSQYHARIKELEEDGCVIEHSTFKNEHGFKSYRLISESTSRGGEEATHRPHKPEIAGANPAPASNKPKNTEWVFDSETQPGKKHHVIDFTTCFVCDCIGYSYRKTCKHTDEVKKSLAQESAKQQTQLIF